MLDTTAHPRPPRTREHRLARHVRAAAAGVLVTAVLLSGAVGAGAPARAATGGVGWGTFGDPEYKFAGVFTQDGVPVLCGEVGKPSPVDALENIGLRDAAWVSEGLSSRWGERPALGSDLLAGINGVLTRYADTGDPNVAAGLEYGVHRVMYPADALRNFSGDPMDDYDAVIRYDLVSRIGDDNVAAIQAIAGQVAAEIRSTAAGWAASGSGTLVFETAADDPHRGTVTMQGTPESTGRIALTGGVFAATGEAVLEDAHEGIAYPIEGLPPLDGSPGYRIAGTGTFTPPGESGPAAEVTVWWSPWGQQASLSAGGWVEPEPFAVAGEDAQDRSLVFRPTLTTRAAALVPRGEPFRDTLVFATADAGDGNHAPWLRTADGYVPVTADGVVYGPFPAPPSPADTAPAGAPVAGRATMTTGPDGPTVSYDIATAETAGTTGYYTWVWTIAAGQQPAATRALLPAGYVFSDRFGLPEETSATPMRVTATTQADSAEIPLGGMPGDRAMIAHDGLWLRDDAGVPLPVVVRWDAYLHPGSAPVPRVPGNAVPAEAVLLGSHTRAVTGPGTIRTPEDPAELGFRAPASGEGWIVWVLRIRAADQGGHAALIEEWSDDYGVPAEVQRLAQPTVRTAAQPGARPGEPLVDVATVGGTLPENGLHLVFEGFRLPTGPAAESAPDDSAPDDSARAPRPEDDLSAVCTPENRVIDTSGEPVLVTAPGAYSSPAVTVVEAGLIVWRESAWSVPRDGEPAELIARGRCGIPEETSTVVEVTTLARGAAGITHPGDLAGAVAPGEEVWDTVSLTGWAPVGGTVEAALHLFGTEAPACTPETLLWRSEPVPLTGGWHPDGLAVDLRAEGQSTHVPADLPEGWRLGFVETVRDGLGRLVAEGTCGVPGETVEVALPRLAETGSGPGPVPVWTLVGAFAAVLGLGLAVVARHRRNRSPRR